jgi:multidrug resistance efflux pump
MKGPRRPFFVMLTISVFIFLAIVAIDYLTPVPPRQRLRALRQELAGLRSSADSCRSALESEEARLQASDARFDSLRNLIDYYEGLDPRGVPADSYEVYLDAFNTYNESIPERAAAGDTLKAHWEVCRGITAKHNAIADSARALAEELGLMRDSVGDGNL